MLQHLLWAGAGTGFTFFMTTLGAAMVFLVRNTMADRLQRCFLGFAAGVMIAASVWSLLIPAIELGESQGLPGWLPAAAGFALGVCFLLGLDHLLPHLHTILGVQEGLPSHLHRTTLLVLAVTLHNIPEGMAVGLSFALAAQQDGNAAALAGAMALALGIGIQNFPEGAAVSLPLCSEGMSRGRAFVAGSLSGIVEPLLAPQLRRRGYALRSSGRADPGGQYRPPQRCRNPGSHGGIFGDDGAGCDVGVSSKP